MAIDENMMHTTLNDAMSNMAKITGVQPAEAAKAYCAGAIAQSVYVMASVMLDDYEARKRHTLLREELYRKAMGAGGKTSPDKFKVVDGDGE